MANPNPKNKFQRGQAPPPRGLKRPITDRLSEMLDEEMPKKVCQAMGVSIGSTYGDGIAMAMVRKALSSNGDQARKDLADRLEGKPAQSLQIMGPQDKAFEILVSYREAPQTNKKVKEVPGARTLDLPASTSTTEEPAK